MVKVKFVLELIWVCIYFFRGEGYGGLGEGLCEGKWEEGVMIGCKVNK